MSSASIKKIIPCKKEQLVEMVLDIEKYPEFVPWCIEGKVYDKNESADRSRTLPSHYTLTHYVSGKDPDVFYHPAKDLLSRVNPDLDEWTSAKSLYINEGDVIIHPSFLEYSTPKVNKRRVTITLLFNIEKIPT